MRKMLNLISMLLTVLMVISSFTTLFVIDAFAADTETTQPENGGETEAPENKPNEAGDVDYINDVFANPDEKLATMRVAVEKDGFRLYVDDYSGEVACVNTLTGEKIFTNPYDVASATGNEDTKQDILSQIIVTFTDNMGQEKIFTSYKEAALRNQIVTEPIKNGIRVEYTIGRESSKVLVPRLISYERFEKMILAPLLEIFGDELYNPRPENPDLFDVQKMLSYYIIYSKDKLDISKAQRKRMDNLYGGLYDAMGDAQYAKVIKSFPIIETLPVFVFDPGASETELTKAEEIIKKYCPEYTYEEMEYDHILTEYKSDSDNPPVFRMALEYTIEKDGMSVRLPANGIRFNESLYTLSDITVLPYMGAGNSGYSGYNFFPDGSGTLFDFEQLNTTQTRSVIGKVYGTDFAYHEITGTYQKTIRYPVFGIVEDTTYYTYTEYDNDTDDIKSQIKISGAIVEAIKAASKGESLNACEGQTEALSTKYNDIINGSTTIETKSVEKRGFVAIIEEGDALASISTYHSGALSDYNTIKMQFTPRPKDSYNLSDSISVGANTEWTVVSERKYVGNYRIRYVLLSDTESKDSKSAAGKYDASWFGMAVAYRDYLTESGVLTKKTSDDVKTDIPLYIETFGAIETTEKILSIPVTVMAPLTTFENVEEIYKSLSDQGMKNINFKLTGYANGGMKYTVPGNLKFEKAVGGNDGFQALLNKADEINKADSNSNFGVFPDFDFAYSINSELFGLYNSYTHAAQTIDGRYASKKAYSATQQKYENYYEMVISPAYFHEFYEKLTGNYLDKFQHVTGISVSTLGTALNSDFDEDEPYNREDAKGFTVDAFKYFDEKYNEVMTDGGNAYVWKYVDHMLNVSLDSSRYNFSAKAVPFVGVVLHGSISFTGEPLNMEGDIQYAILKAIENGASPYFILSYQNTDALKEDKQLSKYYSIRYDIWENDIVDVYENLNSVLSDVQDKYITNHEFLTGSRVPDADELTTDILNEYNAQIEAEKNAAAILEKEIAQAASIARENGRIAEAYAAEAVVKALDLYKSQMDYVNKATVFSTDFYVKVKQAYVEYMKVKDYENSEDPAKKEAYNRIRDVYTAVYSYNKNFEDCLNIYDSAYATLNAYKAAGDNDNNKNLKNALYAIYKSYANGGMLYSQIDSEIALITAEYQLDKAIADYVTGAITKDQLDTFIDGYAVSKIDATTFNNAVSAYLEGSLADEACENVRKELESAKKDLKNKTITQKEFDAVEEKYRQTIASYQKGTLNREALDEIINSLLGGNIADKKAALDATIEKYKSNAINVKELDSAISEYALANLDAQSVLDAVDTYDTAKSAFEIAENNNTLKKINESAYNAALNTYEKAKTELEVGLADYINGKINVNRYKNRYWTPFQKAQSEYEAKLAAYNVVEMSKDEAQTAYDAALAEFDAASDTFNQFITRFFIDNINAEQFDEKIEEYQRYADAYYMYVAADDAFNTLISSGFAVDYEECFNTYLERERLSRYSTWGKIATAEGADPEAYECYKAYIRANIAVEELEKTVKSQQKGGILENYTIALAQFDVLTELGYNRSADTEKVKQYEKAQTLANQARRSAITALAFADSKLMRDLKDLLVVAQEHLVRANEAIDVLAMTEGVTVKYEDGKNHSVENIINRDEIDSFIVGQAIDRAMAVYNYVMADKYTPISYGKDTEYTHNGHALKSAMDSANNTYYFYGEYESGYSYFKRNSDGTFSVYTKGTSTGVKNAQGQNIFEYEEGGEKFYYTASVDGGYTYYTKVSSDVYVERDPTIYNGKLVAELDNGTKIYLDGDVYYSEDGDGTYTRYTYQKSIKSCLDEADVAKEKTKINSNALVESSSDKTIATDLQARIDRNYLMSIKGEEQEEENADDASVKYNTENIVAVTYGNDNGSDYKTIILNYNNYTVRVVYDDIEYTIPAHGYVEALGKEG
jgi:hypothetical protein